jgi:hypothetical protein
MSEADPSRSHPHLEQADRCICRGGAGCHDPVSVTQSICFLSSEGSDLSADEGLHALGLWIREPGLSSIGGQAE